MSVGIEVSTDVRLAPFTTLGVGGPARYFAVANREEHLTAAFEFAGERNLPVFVLGGGSNVVVSDRGFAGVVIRVALAGISFGYLSSDERVRAEAGEDWDAFVAACVARGLAGVECLSGIPGTVGGTPVQNVGAYGQEVSETISSVRCFDRERCEFVDLSKAECDFSYRSSVFNTTMRERYVVTSVVFDLQRGGNPRLSYRELQEHFAGTQPTLAEAREAVLAIRRRKSMVVDTADRNSRSAGSFFKNPIVPAEMTIEISRRAGGATVPTFRAGDGLVKLPAAWLIERAGFMKGFRLGRAGISENHSLAIVNLGGATAADIVALKETIQEGVRERFGIELTPEPVFVGF